jgi:hypothetical protein
VIQRNAIAQYAPGLAAQFGDPERTMSRCAFRMLLETPVRIP